ncbi:MAG: hypothetical protein ACR2J5_08865, partial [Geodermatophilaceae bacterium]
MTTLLSPPAVSGLAQARKAVRALPGPSCGRCPTPSSPPRSGRRLALLAQADALLLAHMAEA